MKRDLEILVALLEDVEQRVEVSTYQWSPRLDGVDFEVAVGHVHLAIDDRLIDMPRPKRSPSGTWDIRVPRLTSAGHDYLDALRTADQRKRFAKWTKTKGVAGAMGLAIFRAFLSKLLD